MRLALVLFAACSSTPAPARLALGWRTELGALRVSHATALDGGDVLLGATFNPQTTLPDMVDADKLAADFVVLGKDGATKQRFRVPGGQLKAVAHVGARVVAAVLRPGWQIALLDLDLATGKVTREATLLTTDKAPSVALAAQQDGLVVLLGEFDGKTDTSTLIGYAPDGTERWRRSFAYQIEVADVGNGELAVFEQLDKITFGARTLDAAGKDREHHEAKLLAPDEYMSRGSFTGAVRDGDHLVWFGHAGGPMQLDGQRHERTNTPSEPFSLIGRTLVELDPGNGFVTGVGRLAGRPVAIIWTNDRTRGVYATAAGEPRLPIYEYTTDASEDHETTVTGAPIHVDEVVATPTAMIVVGRCGATHCAQQIH